MATNTNVPLVVKESDIKFHLIPHTLTEPFTRDFPGYKEGLVRAEPGGITLTPDYARDAQEIYNFEPRTDDVWVLSFPKSGTNWTSDLVWLILNNCDTEAIKGTFNDRSPMLEGQSFVPRSTTNPELQSISKSILPTIDDVAKLPSPRTFKSHIPFYMLHPMVLDTSKVIYVARNPKDVIVSFCHHHKLVKLHDFQGDVELFAQYFMNNDIISTPYFNHVLDAWSKRNHPNMLFVFYEDMKKDYEGEIRKVANFLNKPITEEQVKKLSDFLKFSNRSKTDTLRSDDMVNSGFVNAKGLQDRGFLRQGKTGDWMNHFNPQLNDQIDQWIEKHLAGSDLKFVTQLSNQRD